MELFYCENCARVFDEKNGCPYCSGKGIGLKKSAPVNVIGTKLKGNIFGSKEGKVFVVVRTEDNSKLMKEYNPNNLRKII